jgi:hypothetical protein
MAAGRLPADTRIATTAASSTPHDGMPAAPKLLICYTVKLENAIARMSKILGL